MMRVVTARPVGFQILKETLHHSCHEYGLTELSRFSEGTYVAQFKNSGGRERVQALGPWHFKQDIIALKPLKNVLTNVDREDCRCQIWVQIHHPAIKRMTRGATQKIVAQIGTLMDPSLEGMEKWDRYARLRVEIDLYKLLIDEIPIVLPGEEKYVAYIHYERVARVRMYCSKMRHEIETCEIRNELMAGIRSYSIELHETLLEKIKPRYGGWVSRSYLLPKMPPLQQPSAQGHAPAGNGTRG
jgi:Domain of unknown function (DUF4283)